MTRLTHTRALFGSVRGLTDDTGSLTGTTDYDAFGAVRAQTGSSLALGFTGELTDPTTGFIDLRARDLDPTLGRFLSADTVSPNAPGSQGYNLYAYAANNPTTWADLSGHSVGSVVDSVASLVAACLAYRPCGVLLEEQAALTAAAFVSGNVLLGIGFALTTLFVLLWCALTEPCLQTSHDIQLIANTYGGGVDTGGGNRPPSPVTCIEDAVEGWAESEGNATTGIDDCADRIETENERFQELAKDPAHGGEITDKSRHEAEIGLSLEQSGKLRGPIKRDLSGGAEFEDDINQFWDIKSFYSSEPPVRGSYTRAASMTAIRKSFRDNENVILDTTYLSEQDEQDLREAVAAEPGWSARIIWWPR